MFPRVNAVIERTAPGAIVVLGCLLVLVLAVADILTGPDLAFSPLYLLPIAFVAWGSSRRAALGVAGLSTLAWLVADLVSGRPLPQVAIMVWNTSARLAVNVSIVLLVASLHRALQQAQQLADTDALTGLANRRRLSVLLTLEIARAQRYWRPFTLVYLDLDNFKQVNDRYGHAVGDRLLTLVSAALAQHTRTTDLAARRGGDEFVLLLVETGEAEASLLLAGLEARVAAAVAGLTSGIPVSLSVGAVTFRAAPLTAEAALRMADELMLAVKATGKAGLEHRVITTTAMVADGPPPSTSGGVDTAIR